MSDYIVEAEKEKRIARVKANQADVISLQSDQPIHVCGWYQAAIGVCFALLAVMLLNFLIHGSVLWGLPLLACTGFAHNSFNLVGLEVSRWWSGDR